MEITKRKLEEVIYLDSQRVFDEVLHKRLLRKLGNHWAKGKRTVNHGLSELRDRGERKG